MVLEGDHLATVGLSDLELIAAEVSQDLHALYRVALEVYRTGLWDQRELGAALRDAAFHLVGEDPDQFEWGGGGTDNVSG